MKQISSRQTQHLSLTAVFVVLTLVELSSGLLEKGKLIWSDEFDYVSAMPDENKWTPWVNDGGAGLSNAQTDRNAYTDGTSLVLELRKEPCNGKNYTGANLVSKRGFRYGIFEMRAKLGKGAGTWSNFWLYPDSKN